MASIKFNLNDNKNLKSIEISLNQILSTLNKYIPDNIKKDIKNDNVKKYTFDDLQKIIGDNNGIYIYNKNNSNYLYKSFEIIGMLSNFYISPKMKCSYIEKLLNKKKYRIQKEMYDKYYKNYLASKGLIDYLQICIYDNKRYCSSCNDTNILNNVIECICKYFNTIDKVFKDEVLFGKILATNGFVILSSHFKLIDNYDIDYYEKIHNKVLNTTVEEQKTRFKLRS